MVCYAKKLLLIIFVVLLPLDPSSKTVAQTATAQGEQQATNQTRRLLAIRNVTVISATGAPPLANATLVIRGEQIAAIGSAAKMSIPPGARVINGTGKFLLPGFIEMHAHLSKTRASALGLFVANGVTTLRDMGGDRIGVGSPEEARRIVAQLATREIDFLKIRTVQDRETYLALNHAANAHGLKLVGHVTGIPPDVVLAAGQDGVEHSFYPSLDGKTREERLAVWRQFAERGVAVVPTLITFFESVFPPTERLRAVAEDEQGRVDSRRSYVSKYLVLDWREQVLEATDQRRQTLRQYWENSARRDLREMHEAGLELLVGSDAAVLNIFPGYSLHDEMALFVSELGMTPAEVIERATRRSARFLGILDQTGTVEEGKIADLVLLDANPLDDIRNTRRISAVILRGTLYDTRGLKRILAAVRSAPDIRIDDWGRTSPARNPK
jgi:hypothetical protein